MTTARLILKGEESLQDGLRAAAADPAAAALLCDIDGTISPIAPTPFEAAVPEEFRSVLLRLTERLGLVAFVTGRDLDDGRRMVDVPGAAYVGTHGLDIMDASGRRTIEAAAQQWLPTVREMVTLAQRSQLEPLGVLIEDKGTSFALHYRPAKDRAAAMAAVVKKVVEPAQARGLWIANGYLAFEVRPPVAVNKGTAAARLLAAGEFRVALFLGDDLTDCNGFDAVRAWAREAPARVAGPAAGVARRSRVGLAIAALTDETWEEVRTAADVWAAATPGIYEVLTRLLSAVGS